MAEQKKKAGRPATRKPVRFELSISQEMKELLVAKAQEVHRPVNFVAYLLLEQSLGIKQTEDKPKDQRRSKYPHADKPVGEKSDKMMSISLQPELKSAVRAIAKLERRTVSSMACLMLRDWVAEWERTHPDVILDEK